MKLNKKSDLFNFIVPYIRKLIIIILRPQDAVHIFIKFTTFENSIHTANNTFSTHISSHLFNPESQLNQL